VKESLFLLAVYRDIGCVKVQNETFGRLAMAGNKLIQQNLVQIYRYGTILALLEATECRGTGERLGALTAGLQSCVKAQLIVIIKIFITSGNGQQTLTNQLLGLVSNGRRSPGIIDDTGNGTG
jgi:hypothetical protein